MIPLLRRTAVLLGLLACILTAIAQAPADAYTIDRTPDQRICDLPMIYFQPGTADLEPGYELDLAFLAHLMKKYRKIDIRLQPDLAPAPNDAEGRLLLQERLDFLIIYLHEEYGIRKKRFVRQEYRNISRGYEPPMGPPPPLVDRRIMCDCVWE